jgi:AAA domain
MLPDLERVAKLLGGEVRAGQVLAPGPAHSTADRSMSVKPDPNAPDGFVVNSFAGDDPIACKDHVRQKLGLPKFKPNGGRRRSTEEIERIAREAVTAAAKSEPKSRAGVVVATYDYNDEHGKLLYQALRYEPKDFRQRRPDGNGGWIWELEDRRVLYRLPELLKYPDATVFFTEGEKDAERIISLGHCATTVAHGKWTSECAEALAGRDVWIIEDNDDKGRKRAREAAEALDGTAKSIRVVQLPGLPDRGDVSDWLDAGHSSEELIEACTAAPPWKAAAALAKGQQNGAETPTPNNLSAIVGNLPLTLDAWLSRDLPPPDCLVGEWLTTTSRVLFSAATGLGKTNFILAVFAYLAAGIDFLHWRVTRPRRVLYFDGEMSRRLLKQRAEDIVRRLGARPSGLLLLSHEDIPDFQPLNSLPGQDFIREVVRQTGAEATAFDNIMSLIPGDMKEEESWRDTLPLVSDLTKRHVGQVWLHHAGHDASRGYGTKTREWRMDTVIHGTEVKREDTDVSFLLEFRKARERTPYNRHDFQDVDVALVNDQWTSSVAKAGAKPPTPIGAKFLAALVNVFAGGETVPFQNWKAVKIDHWRLECERMGLIEKGKTDSARAGFSKYKLELITRNHIACNNELVWTIKGA